MKEIIIEPFDENIDITKELKIMEKFIKDKKIKGDWEKMKDIVIEPYNNEDISKEIAFLKKLIEEDNKKK